jgi:hypothetical protein
VRDEKIRSLAETKLMDVPPGVAREALRLAHDLLAGKAERSESSARTSAARIVAAQRRLMPGPILVAMAALAATERPFPCYVAGCDEPIDGHCAACDHSACFEHGRWSVTGPGDDDVEFHCEECC